jgi:hypothetical protein
MPAALGSCRPESTRSLRFCALLHTPRTHAMQKGVYFQQLCVKSAQWNPRDCHLPMPIRFGARIAS